jgi:hypothetical protein
MKDETHMLISQDQSTPKHLHFMQFLEEGRSAHIGNGLFHHPHVSNTSSPVSRTLAVHLRDKSGVYRLECEDCPATYIGQSGRKLRIRVSEHVNAVRKNHPTESLSLPTFLIRGEDSPSRKINTTLQSRWSTTSSRMTT